MTAAWDTEGWVLLGLSVALLAAFLVQLLVSRLTSVPIPMLKRHMHVAGLLGSALLILRTPDLRGFRTADGDWSPPEAHLFTAETLVLVRRCNLYICHYCQLQWIWATYQALHTHMRRTVPLRLRRTLQVAFAVNCTALLLLDVLGTTLHPRSERFLPALIANVLMAVSVALFAAVQVLNHVRLRRSIQVYLAERKRNILASEAASAAVGASAAAATAAAVGAATDGLASPLFHHSAGHNSAPVTPRTSTHAKIISLSQYSSHTLAATHMGTSGGVGPAGVPAMSPSKKDQRINPSWSVSHTHATSALAATSNSGPGNGGGGAGAGAGLSGATGPGPSALLLSMGIASRRGDIFLELPLTRPSFAAVTASSGSGTGGGRQGSFSTTLETLHYPPSALTTPAMHGASEPGSSPLFLGSPLTGAGASGDPSSASPMPSLTPVFRHMRHPSAAAIALRHSMPHMGTNASGRARSGSNAESAHQPGFSPSMDPSATEVEMGALTLPPTSQLHSSFRGMRSIAAHGAQTAPIPEYAAGRGETPSRSHTPTPDRRISPGRSRRRRTGEGSMSRHESGHFELGHVLGPSSRVPVSHPQRQSQSQPQSPVAADDDAQGAAPIFALPLVAPVPPLVSQGNISSVLQDSTRHGSLGGPSALTRPVSLARSGPSFVSAAGAGGGGGGGAGGGGGSGPSTGGTTPGHDFSRTRTRNRSMSLSAFFVQQSPLALLKLRNVLGFSAGPLPHLTGTEARLAEVRVLEARMAHIACFFGLSFAMQLALFVGTIVALSLGDDIESDSHNIPWGTLADALVLFAGAVVLWYSWVCSATTLRSCAWAHWNWNLCDSRLPNAARRVRDAHDLAFGVMPGAGTPQLRVGTLHSGRPSAGGSKLMLLDEERERSVLGSRTHTHGRSGWNLPPPSPQRASYGQMGRRTSESSFFSTSVGLAGGHGHGAFSGVVAPNAGTGFLQPSPSPTGPVFASASEFGGGGGGSETPLMSPSPRASQAPWHPALARIDTPGADAEGLVVLPKRSSKESPATQLRERLMKDADNVSIGVQLTPRAMARAVTDTDTDGDANRSPQSDFGVVSPTIAIPVSWPRHSALVPPSGPSLRAHLVSDPSRTLQFGRSDSVVSEIIDAGAISNGADVDSPGGTSMPAPMCGPFEDPCVLPPRSLDAHVNRPRTVAFSTPEPSEDSDLASPQSAATPPVASDQRTHAPLSIRVRSDSDMTPTPPSRVRVVDAPYASNLSPPNSLKTGTRRLQVQRPLPLPNLNMRGAGSAASASASSVSAASEAASSLPAASSPLPPTGRVHIKMRKSSPSPAVFSHAQAQVAQQQQQQRSSPGTRTHRIALRTSLPVHGSVAAPGAAGAPAASSSSHSASPAVAAPTLSVPSLGARKGSESSSRAAADAVGFRITVDRPRSVYASRRSHHSLEFSSPPHSPGIASGGHGTEVSLLAPHSYAGLGLGSVRSSQLGVPGGCDGSDGLGLRSALSSPTPDGDPWSARDRDVEKSTHVSSIHLHSQRSTRHGRHRSGGMGSIDDDQIAMH